jgi:hypothetical protein
MSTQIKFGTLGWRGVIAQEFTFANVRRAVNGIARHVASRSHRRARVIVGRNPRGKPLGQQLRELFGNVGSFHPERDNFRLTEEVKAKFTKKLTLEPKDFSGRKVKEVCEPTASNSSGMMAHGFAIAFRERNRWFVCIPKQAAKRD